MIKNCTFKDNKVDTIWEGSPTDLYIKQIEKANAELVKALREAADELEECGKIYNPDEHNDCIEEYREIADKYDRRIKESDCE